MPQPLHIIHIHICIPQMSHISEKQSTQGQIWKPANLEFDSSFWIGLDPVSFKLWKSLRSVDSLHWCALVHWWWHTLLAGNLNWPSWEGVQGTSSREEDNPAHWYHLELHVVCSKTTVFQKGLKRLQIARRMPTIGAAVMAAERGWVFTNFTSLLASWIIIHHDDIRIMVMVICSHHTPGEFLPIFLSSWIVIHDDHECFPHCHGHHTAGGFWPMFYHNIC